MAKFGNNLKKLLSKCKIQTTENICTATAKQRQDQIQQKPEYNHSPAKVRPRPGEAYVQLHGNIMGTSWNFMGPSLNIMGTSYTIMET